MLHRNGNIKYYKDLIKHKGTIVLSKTTKIFKTAKNQIEIPVTKSKTYTLIEDDCKERHTYATQNSEVKCESFKNLKYLKAIDEWIAAIENVI